MPWGDAFVCPRTVDLCFACYNFGTFRLRVQFYVFNMKLFPVKCVVKNFSMCSPVSQYHAICGFSE